jgi:hypothetical protein
MCLLQGIGSLFRSGDLRVQQCANQCASAMVLAFYLTLLALHARPGGDAPLWHDEIIELKPTDSVLFFLYIKQEGEPLLCFY